MKKGVGAVVRTAIFSACAEVIMVLGYFLFETVLYGVKTALADILGNGMQGVVGVIAATIVCSVLSATGVIDKIKNLTGGGN